MKLVNPFTLLFITIAMVIIILILAFAPTATTYSVYNNDWNGISSILEMGGKILLEYDNLLENPSTKAIITISQKNFTKTEVELLIDFVKQGGILIILSEKNNLLLSYIGDINVINIPVLDSLFYYKVPQLPIATAILNNTNMTIVLDIPKSLEIKGDWTPFIVTSNYSFMDMNYNGTLDPFETRGSYIIGAYRKIGLGYVYVISDNDVFINSIIKLYNNKDLLEYLRSNRNLFIDLKHLQLSTIDQLKVSMYLIENNLPRLLELVIVAITAVGYFFLIIRREGGIVKEKVFRLYVVVLIYTVILSVFLLLFNFDYVLATYIVILLALLIFEKVDLGLLILTSLILYITRDSTSLLLLLPVIGLYPLLYYKPFGSKILFLGPSTTHAIRTLGLLTPIVLLRPIEVSSFLLLILSILAWSTWKYSILGKVSISIPNDVIEAVLNEETKIPINVKTGNTIYLNIEYFSYYSETRIDGDTIVLITHKFPRLGLQNMAVRLELYDENKFSRRVFEATINVNVIPAIRKLLRILESSIGNIPLGGGMIVTKEVYPGRSHEIGYTITDEVARTRYTIIREYTLTRGPSPKSLRGEYYGVREFVPGDNPRNIHWKKSLTKGELITKEFSIGLEGSRSLNTLIIFADLISSNVEEFDRISYRLITIILRHAVLNPNGRILLLLTLPNGTMEVLVGGAKDILIEVYKMFKEKLLLIDEEYRSMSSELREEEIKTLLSKQNFFFLVIKEANKRFYANVLSILGKLGFDTPTYYTIIHGRPTSFKYSFIKYLLNKLGYTYISEPAITLTEIHTYGSILPLVL